MTPRYNTPEWLHGRLQATGSERASRKPEVGELVVIGATQTSAGKPRRIVSVREDERDGRKAWIVEHTEPNAEPTTGERGHIGYWVDVGWPRLPEHYPICGTCMELMPCRHVAIDVITEQSAEQIDRYNTPGMCPACSESITTRQKTVTFQRNLYGFGPVTFHLRSKCHYQASQYDLAAHDEDGEHQITCPGVSQVGRDKQGVPVTYCTEESCRGAERFHPRQRLWTSAYLPCPDGYHRSPEGGIL